MNTIHHMNIIHALLARIGRIQYIQDRGKGSKVIWTSYMLWWQKFEVVQFLPPEHVWCSYDVHPMFRRCLQKHMVISVSHINDAPPSITLQPFSLSCMYWSLPILATRACMMFIWCSFNVRATFTKVHFSYPVVCQIPWPVFAILWNPRPVWTNPGSKEQIIVNPISNRHQLLDEPWKQ